MRASPWSPSAGTWSPGSTRSASSIEVYGDSVSAGEVSEAVEYCGQPDPQHNGEFSNSYYSYAWLTARKLGARLHDIAQGGAALLDDTGWYKGGTAAADGSVADRFTGMETIYDKLQYHLYLGPAKTWNFDDYRPQVVIVAFGQNDSNPEDYMAADYDGEKAVNWREHYRRFLLTLRRIHPMAHIICTTTILGHDAAWDRAIDQVCGEMEDSRVHHFLYSRNGCGTSGHIRIPEAEKMAEELSAYIQSLGEELWEPEDRLTPVMERARRGERITVGYLGGSITMGSLASAPEKCYAYRSFLWWKETFPGTEFTFVNAGIGGTTSHFGTARAEEDLLAYKPDVVFVEFSVNDENTAHFQETYEGLVRRVLNWEGHPAVILLHNGFYADGRSAQQLHSQVGAYYGIPSVSFRNTVVELVRTKAVEERDLTPDGLHPNDRGHELLAGQVRQYLDTVYRQWRKDAAPDGGGKPCSLPRPLTANRYEAAVRLRNHNAEPVSVKGFTADREPQETIGDVFRKGWYAGNVGDEITFSVEASCIALQYRKTVRHPAPKAVAILDGQEDKAVLLDGDFDEDWGDCLYLQELLEGQERARHTVTVRIREASPEDQLPFYLVSLILA